MINVEYLHECSGADRFGTCVGCGKGSDEDIWMSRVTIIFDNYGHRQGNSFCLCGKCRNVLLRKLEWNT